MRRVRFEVDGKSGIRVTERQVNQTIKANDTTGINRPKSDDLLMEFPFELSEPDQFPIGQGYTEIRFSYYGIQPLTKEYGWVDEWDSQSYQSLPEAIQMKGRRAVETGLEGEFQWIFPLPNRAVGLPENKGGGG